MVEVSVTVSQQIPHSTGVSWPVNILSDLLLVTTGETVSQVKLTNSGWQVKGIKPHLAQLKWSWPTSSRWQQTLSSSTQANRRTREAGFVSLCFLYARWYFMCFFSRGREGLVFQPHIIEAVKSNHFSTTAGVKNLLVKWATVLSSNFLMTRRRVLPEGESFLSPAAPSCELTVWKHPRDAKLEVFFSCCFSAV